MKFLVTGAAGFIGYHVCQRLVANEQVEVLGVDNLNDYYPVSLKRARLAQLEGRENFRFLQSDFADSESFAALHEGFAPDYLVHLGAQAGVRYSEINPGAYVHSNLKGFQSVLEALRKKPVKHTVFASSSSVYGRDARVPFSEADPLGKPLSFYAETKQANEKLAQEYALQPGLPLTGLRFFTVYGPWGRPDMTPWLFTKAIVEGSPIRLYASGTYKRDFTYVEDIVEGVLRALLYPPREVAVPPFRVFNLGHHRPVEMSHFVRCLEEALQRKARVELLPPVPTEMPETCADLTRVREAVGYEPRMPLEQGLKRLVDWYLAYYGQAPQATA